MCLCRRSSGSDTWPDLLHSTIPVGNNGQSEPLPTAAGQPVYRYAYRKCSHNAFLRSLRHEYLCDRAVTLKNCPLLLHMWNELITAPCGCSGRIHRRQKSDYFFERKRWKKMKRSWAGSQPFLGLFFFITLLYLFHNECFVIQFRITKSKATKYKKKQTPSNAELLSTKKALK